MILYRKEPVPLQMKNIMLLDDAKTGGVVYVSKTTYDQALLLHGRFDGDVQRVITTLKNKKTEAYIVIPGLKELINLMATTMPEPLNILAPFLMFTTQNQGMTWSSDDREKAYGVLHQLSQLVDFNAITLVPAEVRANITVPTAILNQYQDAWDELCSTLADKVVLVQTQSIASVVQSNPVVEAKVVSTVKESVKVEEPEDDVKDGEDTIDEEAYARLMASLASVDEEADKKKAEDKTSTVEEPKSDKLLADKEEEERQEACAVLDEFDC